MAVARSFDDYRSWLTSGRAVDTIIGQTGFSRAETHRLLHMSVEEARFG